MSAAAITGLLAESIAVRCDLIGPLPETVMNCASATVDGTDSPGESVPTSCKNLSGFQVLPPLVLVNKMTLGGTPSELE